uniref:TFIIS N-terminal domain-containing protein n=1 Tax=Oryza rufipogon TaxID=4529 RepID=A0A0E0QPN2_ORYRU
MEVVYKAISLMHRWKVLLPKERDREALNMLLEKLKAKIDSLHPMNVRIETDMHGRENSF